MSCEMVYYLYVRFHEALGWPLPVCIGVANTKPPFLPRNGINNLYFNYLREILRFYRPF